MKRLLTYLFPMIVAAAFAGATDVAVYPSQDEESSVADIVCETVCPAEFSAAESELCLPRQVSYANTHQVQSSARRTNGAQKNNVEFIRSGKVINAGIRYFIQNKSVIVHSRLTEPAALLLSLGRLII